MMSLVTPFRRRATGALMGLVLALGAAPLAAQAELPIDGDLATPGSPEASTPAAASPAATDPTEAAQPGFSLDGNSAGNGTPMPQPIEQSGSRPADPVVTSSDASEAASQASADPEAAAAEGNTYKKDDLMGAAEGVFGKGAEGLARMIETWLDKQGEPNGYIVGREGGGAFIAGLRYGSGTLYHKVEGQRPVYWTGPSVGLDFGANAGNTFILVYNLYDTEDLYKRFAAVEGQAYVVGGLHASYLRHGDVVLIPIRMGVGVRLGVNAGYMKIRKNQKWIPF